MPVSWSDVDALTGTDTVRPLASVSTSVVPAALLGSCQAPYDSRVPWTPFCVTVLNRAALAGSCWRALQADAEFRELLEEVRALASHQQPKGELLLVMKAALEAYRRELQKKRFAVGAKPRRHAGSRAAHEVKSKRTRRVSAAVRRAVYERDHGECTFIGHDGRRCAARQFLELDHVQPWALRGDSTLDNLRLRCRAHNQHAARIVFGDAHMQAAVDHAQNARRERRDAGRARDSLRERGGEPRETPAVAAPDV